MPFTMREMLEAGCHFGHQTRFWNPKMAPFIYGSRNKIHIVNLEHTYRLLNESCKFIQRLSANRGNVLFVCTKRQAKEIIAEEAKRCGMPFVEQRWLGGMLTNFKTIKASVKRLRDMEAIAADGGLERMSKKEALMFERELTKLNLSIGGVKDMPTLPDAIFICDVGFHKIAVTEAEKLGIPVVGIVDTNHSPEGVSYAVPGNDDSARAIRLYARAVADAVLAGREQALNSVVESIKSADEYVEVEDSAQA